MTFNSKILCDADFLVGLFLSDDANHQKSIDIYEKYSDTHDFIVLNLTKYEFATVLSRKLNHNLAIEINKLFLEQFTQEIYFEKIWENDVYELYNSFEKKNISFFHCACLHYAKMVKAKVASFDKFYYPEILA